MEVPIEIFQKLIKPDLCIYELDSKGEKGSFKTLGQAIIMRYIIELKKGN